MLYEPRQDHETGAVYWFWNRADNRAFPFDVPPVLFALLTGAEFGFCRGYWTRYEAIVDLKRAMSKLKTKSH